MNRGVRQALTGVVLLAGLAGAPARAAGEIELDGMYLSEGVNPDGSTYKGVVNITRNGDSFMVSWLTPTSENDRLTLQPASVGVGILSDDMLSVSYYAPQASGIAVYRIEEQGHRLAGRWAVAGKDGAVHAEVLTKLPESAVAPVKQTPIHLPGTRSS